MSRLVLSLFAIAVFSFSGQAESIGIRCDNCSQSQIETKLRVNGFGEHQVYSFPSGTVRSFIVDIEPGLESFQEVPPTSTMISAAKGLKEIYDQSYGSMKSFATSPGDSLGTPFTGRSAFDVVQNGNLRVQMQDRLKDPSRPLTGVSANLNALRAVAESLVTGVVQMRMTVEFSDGTSVDFDIDFVKRDVQYVVGSARTATDQWIPDVANESATGTWEGPESELSNLLDHMRNRGASGRYDGCRYGGPQMTCTWDGHNLDCVVRYPCS